MWGLAARFGGVAVYPGLWLGLVGGGPSARRRVMAGAVPAEGERGVGCADGLGEEGEARTTAEGSVVAG